MKKNLIIQGIVAFGLLLGTAFAAQAAETQPLADTSSSTASAADESSTELAARVCDDNKIKACYQDCTWTHCRWGPTFAACLAKCDTDCHNAYCQ